MERREFLKTIIALPFYLFFIGREDPLMFLKDRLKINIGLFAEKKQIFLVHGMGGNEYSMNDLKNAIQMQIGIDAEIFTYNSKYETIEEAANRLYNLFNSDYIVLIGYSLGGLVSRYAGEKLDGGKRVKKIATIGTPNKGVKTVEIFMKLKTLENVAQWGAYNEIYKMIFKKNKKLIKEGMLERILKNVFGERAFLELNPHSNLIYKLSTLNSNIKYLCIVGKPNQIFTEYRIKRRDYGIITGIEEITNGKTDGLVAEKSARLDDMPGWNYDDKIIYVNSGHVELKTNQTVINEVIKFIKE